MCLKKNGGVLFQKDVLWQCAAHWSSQFCLPVGAVAKVVARRVHEAEAFAALRVPGEGVVRAQEDQLVAWPVVGVAAPPLGVDERERSATGR